MQKQSIWVTALIIGGCNFGWAQPGRGHAGGPPVMMPPPHATGGGARTEVAPAPPPMNAAARINANPALSARIQPLLPSGMTAQTAAAGFRNQGQFLAAVHVSRNLGIPFTQLKAEMTGPAHVSLGRAIQDVRPKLSHNAIKNSVKEAERQAKRDRRKRS